MLPIDFGINFIGKLESHIGLGEAARQVLDAVRLSQLPICERALGEVDLPYRVNLLTTSFPDVLKLTHQQQLFLRTGRYTIAQYYWELPRLKKAFQPALSIADELWAPSRFIQTILSNATTISIQHVPPPIHVTPSAEGGRSVFGLPEKRMVFFFNFNATSSYGRKNPEAIVEAFRRAFPNTHADGPLLVIKSQYLERYPPLYHRLFRLVEDINGVLINKVITRQQMTDLLACADIYVSLHRAEGFGLGMAEAMLLGKPVIATNYSGNTDFMTSVNSYPVVFKLREITAEDHHFQPDFETVYEVGQVWAEPDIDQAAMWMTHLYEHPTSGLEKGEQASRDIQQRYDPAMIGELMRQRFEQIDVSGLPHVQPAPSESMSKSQAQWKRWGQRIYRAAIPTPIRLGLRHIRNPNEFYVPILEPKSIRYQAVEELARAYGHPNIIVLGCDDRHDIAAVAQRFQTTVLDKVENLISWENVFNIHAQPWDKPLSRAVLQQSILIANPVLAPSWETFLHYLETTMEVGALAVVSASTKYASSLASFSDMLRGAGLPVWFQGYADDLYVALLGYPEAPFVHVPPQFRVGAIMPVYNEADIILSTLHHLIAQGVEVYILDNHSTDGTAQLAQSLLGQGVIGVETYPPEPTPYYEWEKLLQRVEVLSQTLDYDWVMLHDCDEIRESFYPEQTLRETLYQIDRGGFNAVNHTVLNFVPTDHLFTASSDLKDHFQYYEPRTRRDYSVQIKTWKKGQVTLATNGGHAAEFEGRQVYPFRFLIRHYPIRSQQHGERKIFQERRSRIRPEEIAQGWHSHLRDFAPQQSFLRNPESLLRMDDSFYEHRLLERLTGVGIYPLDEDRPKRVFITWTKRRLPVS
jgi:glycosyltransferase involved in cell wall biosynthesis